MLSFVGTAKTEGNGASGRANGGDKVLFLPKTAEPNSDLCKFRPSLTFEAQTR
jgi:hypothetical protein